MEAASRTAQSLVAVRQVAPHAGSRPNTVPKSCWKRLARFRASAAQLAVSRNPNSPINNESSAGARELCALFDSFNDRNFAADRAFATGLVSRASPVHTAVRNCTRDEGRPFGFGDQVADPKPPRAAAVKSRGGERRGNVGTMIPSGKVERGERKQTASEASKAD